MWRQIGICPDWQCDERLWHAGLSEDGTKCFVSGFEEHVYIVWDIEKQSVIWRDDSTSGDSEIKPLDEWIGSDGYIALPTGPAAGRYRIFGLNIKNAKTESEALQQVLKVNVKDGILTVL